MQRLAALVPRPRLHLLRFGVRVTSLREVSGPPLLEHGVLPPNAKLRPLVVPRPPPAQAQTSAEAADTAGCDADTDQAHPHRISWVRLLQRVFDIDMRHCPNRGSGELKIIAAILERPVVEKILTHLGLSVNASPPLRTDLRLTKSPSSARARPARLDPQPPPRGRARDTGQD